VGEKITFKDSLSDFTKTFLYDFGDGSVLNNTHNPTHTWDAPSTYTVTLRTKYDFCPDGMATKVIQVDAFPIVNIGKDTSICPGVTGSILIADVNNPGALYDWSTGESASSIVVTQPGTYWATSKGACAVTDSINVIRDCYLNIPNAFTPDGDGLNDYFLPRELLSSGVKTFKMDIYNRWGENIFTTTAIDGRGWDGKYNGVSQPMATYVYIIDVEFNNNLKKNYKGNVILVR
jgi:gliding motility-associated-like protein